MFSVLTACLHSATSEQYLERQAAQKLLQATFGCYVNEADSRTGGIRQGENEVCAVSLRCEWLDTSHRIFLCLLPGRELAAVGEGDFTHGEGWSAWSWGWLG